jgi:hypothetical protein
LHLLHCTAFAASKVVLLLLPAPQEPRKNASLKRVDRYEREARLAAGSTTSLTYDWLHIKNTPSLWNDSAQNYKMDLPTQNINCLYDDNLEHVKLQNQSASVG